MAETSEAPSAKPWEENIGVRRFVPDTQGGNNAVMREIERGAKPLGGSFVRHEDYAELQGVCLELWRILRERNEEVDAACAERAALLEALQAMYRAHNLHIFSPRGQETRSDRDTCRICGGNYRDTLKHIAAQEGHPSDVKAEAARLARAAIARATGEKEPSR